jgi:hypothetical protein
MRILITLLVISILASCTIEKRLYRPGYHIEGNLFSKNHGERRSEYNPQKISRQSRSRISLETTELTRSLKAKPALANYSNACDTIVMNNGDRLAVKIETITTRAVTYRKCDYLDGPIYEESISKIDYFKFSNGKIEKPSSNNYYNQEGNPTSGDGAKGESNEKEIKKPIEEFGIVSISSFVLSMALSTLVPPVSTVLFFASMLAAIVSLTRFSAKPGKYRGKWMAITMLILFGLGIIVGTVFLLMTFYRLF